MLSFCWPVVFCVAFWSMSGIQGSTKWHQGSTKWHGPCHARYTLMFEDIIKELIIEDQKQSATQSRKRFKLCTRDNSVLFDPLHFRLICKKCSPGKICFILVTWSLLISERFQTLILMNYNSLCLTTHQTGVYNCLNM